MDPQSPIPAPAVTAAANFVTLFAGIMPSPNDLISAFGTAGIATVIFIESWLFPFLPGDSLLFTGGFLAAEHKYHLSVWIIAITTSIAAVAGNQVGYLIGRKAGPALFAQPDSRFFKQEYLEKTHAYFETYGPKTVVIARFIPIVRTFAAIIAGVGKMQYKLFLIFNVIGALLWGAGVTGIGWMVAKTVGKVINVDHYLGPIIALIVIISFLPVIIELIKARRSAGKPSGHVRNSIQEEL